MVSCYLHSHTVELTRPHNLICRDHDYGANVNVWNVVIIITDIQRCIHDRFAYHSCSH